MTHPKRNQRFQKKTFPLTADSLPLNPRQPQPRLAVRELFAPVRRRPGGAHLPGRGCRQARRGAPPHLRHRERLRIRGSGRSKG